jgi:tetratricopeptide (TPR) repeat protein
MNRALLAMASALGFAWLMAGCAALPPSSQSFVVAETVNFEVISSLGEKRTRELVHQFELFHAAALAAFDMPTTPARHGRTRVIAFDDRSLGRPFAVRGASAYYLPRVEGGLLVLRAPGGWDHRITRSLRAAYAHRLLRSRSLHRLPLWVGEGLSQVASAAQMEVGEIRLGALIEEHVKEVEDWRRSSLSSVLQKADLSDASAPQRAEFEALSWALAHSLMFGEAGRGQRAPFPEAYLAAFDGAVSGAWQRVADALLGGDGVELAARVEAHLDQPRFALRLLRPSGWDPAALELREVAPADAQVVLGDLALELGRDELARKVFERALEDAPEHARVLAGLAVARSGEFEAALELASRAEALAEGDAAVAMALGRLHARGAGSTDDPVEQGRRRTRAREYFSRALPVEGASARARYEIGRSYLASSEDPAPGLEWLQTAAALRPASLEVDLAIARLEARMGKRRAAHYRARQVASRSQWEALRDEARELVRELDRSDR